jgi:hypothetical protein
MATRSRWWWWIAGLPLSVAFWAMTVLWVSIATEGTGLLANPVRSAAALVTVGLGMPILVIAAMFPVAVYYDGQVVERVAGIDWNPTYIGAIAAATLLTGPILSVPFACWYLWRRHLAVGVP